MFEKIKNLFAFLDENRADIKKTMPLVKKINEIESEIEKLTDSELREKLSENAIRECFDYDYYTKNVDKIFDRVFKG